MATAADTALASLNEIPADAEVPSWAKILITSMKTLIDEFNKMNIVVSKSLELNDKVEVQRAVSNALAKDNEALRDRVAALEKLADENEQHGRNRNLLLKGIPETNNQRENTTDLFVAAINDHSTVNINKNDIERSHRLGRYQNGRNRPIIARFKNETKKIDVYRKKAGFKGSGKSIAENLTKRRQDIYKAACDKLNYRNVWTIEGRIFASHDERKFNIRSLNDIPGFDQNVANPPPFVQPYLQGLAEGHD